MTSGAETEWGVGDHSPIVTEPVLRPSIAGIDCAAALPAFRSPFSITVKLLPGERLTGAFKRLATAMKELDATILKLMIFGSTDASPAADEAMRSVFKKPHWPVLWVEGASCNGAAIAGIQVFALIGGSVEPLHRNGRVVGSTFEADGARHCLLGGIGPGQRSSSRSEQTWETIENMQETLDQAGFSFAEVARTWFYLDDILSWYGEFNRVRTQLYSRIRFHTGSLPASTGIGGRNPDGSALVAGAWAVRPLIASVQVREIASPLQCPATGYGSSFSRAVEISSARRSCLLVSGTASVAPEGETAHVGDITAQVSLSMNVVQGILQSRGISFADVTRATAYFSNAAQAPVLAAWLARHGLHSLPVVCTRSDVCRPDLLFEIELDAARAGH